MIQGVIFDCFGVLYTGSLTYLAGLAPPERREAVYDVNHAADYGLISHDEYLGGIAELIGTEPDEVEKIARSRFVRNEPLVAFVRTLRPRYKTALLSNVGKNVMETLFTPDELRDMFDAVVLSGEVGMVKPYPEIYQLAASNLNLKPYQCVMIDDLIENTNGAEDVGMRGVVYNSVKQVRAELDALLETESRNA